jgi:superoxide reductase
MTMLKQIWKCDICGNIVEIIHEGADSLVCCGQPMNLQKEKMEDPEKGKKHVPVIEGRKVKVGQIEHPMEQEHYIEWIEATSERGETCKVFLKPGDKPEAEFYFEVKSSREYCNLHGLWKV